MRRARRARRPQPTCEPCDDVRRGAMQAGRGVGGAGCGRGEPLRRLSFHYPTAAGAMGREAWLRMPKHGCVCRHWDGGRLGGD